MTLPHRRESVPYHNEDKNHYVFAKTLKDATKVLL